MESLKLQKFEKVVKAYEPINRYTDYSRILKSLRMSRTRKIKANWSREVGAGFIADDIKNIQLVYKKPANWTFKFHFHFGHKQDFSIDELNLRETEEAIEWLERLCTCSKCPIHGD